MSNEQASIDTRASKSGFGADMKKKQEAKYSTAKEDEQKAREWMVAVTGESIGEDFFNSLRDGSYLCRLLNRLKEGLVAKKYETPMSGKFKQMEAIGKFLDGCKEYGMKQDDLFTTLDLYEETDKNMVLSGIIALGRTAQKNGFSGPTLGPKEAEPNPRDFDSEVLAEGRTVQSLQYGSNKGASAAGMTAYGMGRQVYDPSM